MYACKIILDVLQGCLRWKTVFKHLKWMTIRKEKYWKEKGE